MADRLLRWRRAAAAVLLALAFGQPAAAADLRIGVVADVLTLDPHNYRDRNTQTVVGNLYDGLFLRFGTQTVPALVKEFRQIDATTYEATILSGVRFHSGDPMTAEDVKYSLERLTVNGAIAGQTSPRKSLVGPIQSVEVLGPDRLRISLSGPWPIIRGSLASEAIVNRRLIDRIGQGGLATQVDGVGPYKLSAWSRGDNVVMERFADYYGGPAALSPVGPARIDRVIFRVIPETSSRLAALLAGEIDIATEIPVHMRAQIQRSTRAKVMSVNGTRTFFISLNNTRPPFNDIRVRQAANHAVNRKLIIERLLAGTATPLNGVLSPESFGFNPNLAEYGYDPAKAKRLLAEAGHPNGIDITLDTIGANKDLAEVLAAMLSESGIRAKVQVWEGAVLTPLWQDANKKERDAFLTSWGSAALEPTGIFVPTLQTRERGNSAGYSNPAVDKLLDTAGNEGDDAKRSALYQEAQAIVNKDVPWVFLWVPQDIYGVSNAVKDWEPHASGMIYLHRATVAR